MRYSNASSRFRMPWRRHDDTQSPGPLALDYLFNEASGRPTYLEANPRLVEPMNATLSGVNLADSEPFQQAIFDLAHAPADQSTIFEVLTNDTTNPDV